MTISVSPRASVDPLVWVDDAPPRLKEGASRLAATNPGRALLVQDRSGALVAANGAACSVLGLPWNELVARTTSDPRWTSVTEQGLTITGDQHPSRRTMLTGLPVRGFLMGVLVPHAGQGSVRPGRTRWLDVSCYPIGEQVQDHSTTEILTTASLQAGVLIVASDVSDTARGKAATETLLASYRLLGEAASDIVLRTDEHGVIVWASDSIRRALAIEPTHVVGQPMTLWLHPDDITAADAINVHLPAEGRPTEFECRWRIGAHAFRWLSAQVRPISDQRGTIVGAVIGLRDVHDQVLARQELARRESQYRLLAENATDAVYLISTSEVVQWVSPAVTRLLGFEPSELIGARTADLVHPDSRETLRAVQARAQLGEKGIHVELQLRTASGEYRWMSSVSGPATDERGFVVGRIAALRDVHEQVLARQALARSERTLRLAIDGAPQGMALVGLDGRFLLVNDALCRLVGRDRAWLTSHHEDELLSPDRQGPDHAIRDRLLAHEALSVYDIHDGSVVTSDGRTLRILHSIGLVRDEDGRPQFYVSHFQDISGRGVVEPEAG